MRCKTLSRVDSSGPVPGIRRSENTDAAAQQDAWLRRSGVGDGPLTLTLSPKQGRGEEEGVGAGTS